jgi:hypothetical protein
MLAGVDVEILGGDYVGVVAMGRDIVIDFVDQRGATSDSQGTAVAEVVLNVDDDQCPHASTLRGAYPPNKR